MLTSLSPRQRIHHLLGQPQIAPLSRGAVQGGHRATPGRTQSTRTLPHPARPTQQSAFICFVGLHDGQLGFHLCPGPRPLPTPRNTRSTRLPPLLQGIQRSGVASADIIPSENFFFLKQEPMFNLRKF